jgi:NAD(P)-dependent dehydrogenase (short-subunit alcohol dehydrogenase family)
LGTLGFPIQSAYVSTKFAIEGLSESMAYEVEPFGIKVVLIEPGFIKTNIEVFSWTRCRKMDGSEKRYV